MIDLPEQHDALVGANERHDERSNIERVNGQLGKDQQVKNPAVLPMLIAVRFPNLKRLNDRFQQRR